MMMAQTYRILKLSRHSWPPASPGRGSPINTSQGCVDCIKTCCGRAMSGRRYAITRSDPHAYCLTISPEAFWSWFAGGQPRIHLGRYKLSLISLPDHSPFQFRHWRTCYGHPKQSNIMASERPTRSRRFYCRMNAWSSVTVNNRNGSGLSHGASEHAVRFREALQRCLCPAGAACTPRIVRGYTQPHTDL
jgi:hypothetical protein